MIRVFESGMTHGYVMKVVVFSLVLGSTVWRTSVILLILVLWSGILAL